MSRVQLSINVSDFDAAVAFYSSMLGAQPAKRCRRSPARVQERIGHVSDSRLVVSARIGRRVVAPAANRHGRKPARRHPSRSGGDGNRDRAADLWQRIEALADGILALPLV